MLRLVTSAQVNMQKRGSIDRSNRIIVLIALLVIIALCVLYFMKRSELHRIIRHSNTEKVSPSNVSLYSYPLYAFTMIILMKLLNVNVIYIMCSSICTYMFFPVFQDQHNTYVSVSFV